MRRIMSGIGPTNSITIKGNQPVRVKTGGNITFNADDQFVSTAPSVKLADVNNRIEQLNQSETFANILLSKFTEVV